MTRYDWYCASNADVPHAAVITRDRDGDQDRVVKSFRASDYGSIQAAEAEAILFLNSLRGTDRR